MKIITDIIVFFEEYVDAYLVQCEIDISEQNIIGVRQACPLDMPESLILPQGYDGSTKFTSDDFSVIMSKTGQEYVIKYPYVSLMVLRSKQ